MGPIPLRKIVQSLGLDRVELAKTLSPNLKHPLHALDRIMYDTAELSETQIKALSNYTNLSYDDLFSFDNWKSHSEKPGEIIFTKQGFEARFFKDKELIEIKEIKTLKSEQVFISKFITLSELVNKLDKLILKIQKQ